MRQFYCAILLLTIATSPRAQDVTLYMHNFTNAASFFTELTTQLGVGTVTTIQCSFNTGWSNNPGVQFDITPGAAPGTPSSSFNGNGKYLIFSIENTGATGVLTPCHLENLTFPGVAGWPVDAGSGAGLSAKSGMIEAWPMIEGIGDLFRQH